jgi:hypothetical protein
MLENSHKRMEYILHEEREEFALPSLRLDDSNSNQFL